MSSKVGTPEYDLWFNNHYEKCKVNHEGSSGKMEVVGILEMFMRSEDLHSVKYINYIGDGDSKTYKGIIDAKPYGDIPVVKKECINHVQKRMGSRLRALKKSVKGLSGRGRLTDKLINELSAFYGLAIRRNIDNANAMYNDIWATLYHKASSAENPTHFLCPEEPDSWCKFQRANATNTLDTYTEKTPLPEDIVKFVTSIYEDLSKYELLERCVGGFTQNNNECYNSLVWQIAPKITSSGPIIVELATFIAAIIFNDGQKTILKALELLGIRIGVTLEQYCREQDEKRVALAERRARSLLARRQSGSNKFYNTERNITRRPLLWSRNR